MRAFDKKKHVWSSTKESNPDASAVLPWIMGTYEPNFELAQSPCVLGGQTCYWFRLLDHSLHALLSSFLAFCLPACLLPAAAAGLIEVMLLVLRNGVHLLQEQFPVLLALDFLLLL